MKIWIDHVSSKIIPAWHKLLQHTSSSPYSIDDAKNEFKNQIKTWIKEADPGGPWWNGQDFTMADIALAPWVMRHWVFGHFGKDPEIQGPGQGGEDEEIWNRWRTWVKAVEGKETVTKLMSEREHYIPIYKRYAEDKAQSEMAKATREGKPPP
jgi:glutathione S-transferase